MVPESSAVKWDKPLLGVLSRGSSHLLLFTICLFTWDFCSVVWDLSLQHLDLPFAAQAELFHVGFVAPRHVGS